MKDLGEKRYLVESNLVPGEEIELARAGSRLVDFEEAARRCQQAVERGAQSINIYEWCYPDRHRTLFNGSGPTLPSRSPEAPFPEPGFELIARWDGDIDGMAFMMEGYERRWIINALCAALYGTFLPLDPVMADEGSLDDPGASRSGGEWDLSFLDE